MPSKESLDNLKKGSNRRWTQTPTQVIRIPACFVEEILGYAHQLDQGKANTPLASQLNTMGLQELLDLQQLLPEVIDQAREAQCDRTLEQAITFLASCCDSAATNDAAGFSAFDAGFGHWLAKEVDEGRNWQRSHAKMALQMVGKYQNTQLATQGIVLPQWEAIAAQYQDSSHRIPGEQEGQKPEQRLEWHGDEIFHYSPYDPDVVSTVKAIQPRGRFERTDKSWRFPLAAAAQLLEHFGEYEADPAIQYIAEENRRIEEQKRKAEEERKRAAQEQAERQRRAAAQEASLYLQGLIDSANLQEPLPCGWTLFEHQKRGVEWLLAHRRGGIFNGGILADHMGLGKTIAALVAAKALSADQNDCPIFVICPSSLKDNWKREANMVEVGIETFSWAKVPQPLENQDFILIADEAHYAQNSKAARTKKLMLLAQSERCITTWLLTGTPIKNGQPVHLLPLLEAISHPLAQHRWAYLEKYCSAHQKYVGGRTVWDMTGAAHLNELAQKTEDAILRRAKDQCLDLPPKQRILRPVNIEQKQLREYNKELKTLAQAYRQRVEAKEVSPEAEALVTLGNLRRIGSRYKIDSAVQQIEELLEQQQQVVIFTEFLDSARLLKEKLEGAELLTGETPTDERLKIVDRFQQGQAQVFIGTIKAGGVGLTLTASNNVILMDRPWTPGDAEQAEDRCHRIGQKQSVTAFWLQLGDIDQAVDTLLTSKQKRIDLILKGKRKTLRGVGNINQLAQQLLEIL